MYVNGCKSFPDSKLMKLCKVQNACIDCGVLPPYAITPCQQLLAAVGEILFYIFLSPLSSRYEAGELHSQLTNQLWPSLRSVVTMPSSGI